MAELKISSGVDLRPYTTLRAGGRAEHLTIARSADQLVEAFLAADEGPITLLGHGSNVLPSDDGVPGMVLVNLASRIEVSAEGVLTADAGCAFQDLYLKAAQSSLAGLEFAVGIPGTLGGALVSNAGAYRSNVADYVTGLEVVVHGLRQWVEPAWMEFSYRNSKLRRPEPPRCALVRVRLRLPYGDRKSIYDMAREFQRQRIGKQPPQASAGSFFKNVEDAGLAEALVSLPAPLKKAGVVPAGYLLEAAGLKGCRVGGAMFAPRHGNFVVNVGGATATDIRRLACRARREVAARFGVELEEEVLYIGDWTRFGDGIG